MNVTTANQQALARAVSEWSRPVRRSEQSGRDRIDSYIRGEEGLGWSWLKGAYPEYLDWEDNPFNWCGAFGAWCWSSVLPSLREAHFASTPRLHKWAKGTARLIEPRAAQPGDLFVVGPRFGYYDPERKKTYDHGRHIGIVEEVGAGGYKTIEGNAIGEGVGGERYNGVVRDVREFEKPGQSDKEWRILFAVRPLDADLSPDARLESDSSILSTARQKVSAALQIPARIWIPSMVLGVITTASLWFALRPRRRRR